MVVLFNIKNLVGQHKQISTFKNKKQTKIYDFALNDIFNDFNDSSVLFIFFLLGKQRLLIKDVFDCKINVYKKCKTLLASY